MDLYQKNMELINKLLEIALKKDKFTEYVLMMPDYCIETRDLNGIVKPNRKYTMEAIYEYYKRLPNSNIDILLYNTLIQISQKYRGEQAIETVLETVEYQLKAEKNKKAPFELDSQKILSELRNTIIKNKEMYMQQKEEYDGIPFWNYIEQYDLNLNEKYGQKVL